MLNICFLREKIYFRQTRVSQDSGQYRAIILNDISSNHHDMYNVYTYHKFEIYRYSSISAYLCGSFPILTSPSDFI